MRKKLQINLSALFTVLLLVIAGNSWGQWNYDFGTTAASTTSSTASTTFLSNYATTPENGGTYRTRVGTNGEINLVNTGTLGSGAKLQLTTSSGNSTTKFSVHSWNSPTTTAYFKAKIKSNSAASGTFFIYIGPSGPANDNNNIQQHTNTPLVGLKLTYSNGTLSVARRAGSSDSAVTASGFLKDTDQEIEIYANNSSSSTTYSRSGTNSLSAQSWDLFVDGIKISPSGGWPKAGSLTQNTTISGFAVFAESGSATLQIDDLEYNNALPSGYTLSYDGNGNTGGSVPTDNTTYANNANVTVLGNTGNLVKTNSAFAGWNTAANGSGTSYAAGNTFAITAATTLYAKWSTLAPSVTSLTNFTYAQNNGPSASKSFNLTGSNLTAGSTVTATASGTNYEVSTDNATWGNSVTISYTGTSLNSTPVHVRLKAGLTSNPSYTGQINISGSGATATVSLSGNVTNAAPTASNLSIRGTLLVGQTLTSHYTYTDSENDPEGTSTFRWFRADDAAGTNRVQIAGATAATYQLKAADYQKYITFGVTPIATTGATTGAEVISSYVGPVDTTSPTIVISGTLSAVNTVYGTASATTSFNASGTNLEAAIVIAAPAGYEISTSQTSGFTTTLNLPQTDGNVAETIIYVRIAATTPVGTYTGSITLNSTNAAPRSVITSSSNVTKRQLTVTGLTGNNKVYDGTDVATVNGTPTLNNIANNDNVTLSGTAVYKFPNENVGINRAITVTGLDIDTASQQNYTLVAPTTLTGSITVKSVTVTGATATDRAYNGTTSVAITNGTIIGKIEGDDLNIAATGSMADANAGNGKNVTIALTGTDITNYSFTAPTVTVNISKATPAVTATSIGLTVGGTYALPGANVIITSDATPGYSIDNAAIASLSGTTLTGVAAGTATLTVTLPEGTNYVAGTATTVPVVVSSFPIGTYRTTANSTFPTSTPITWEELQTNGQWVPKKPTANTTELLLIRHNFVQNAAFSGADGYGVSLAIQKDGYATLNSVATLRNITVEEGGILEVTSAAAGMRITEATLTVEAGGRFILNSGSINNTTTIWRAKENFKAGSIVEIKNWAFGANGAAARLVAENSQISNSDDGYLFGHLNIIAPATGDKSFNIIDGKQTVNLTHGNLTISGSATGQPIALTNSTSAVTINGNLILEANANTVRLGGSQTPVVTVKGNVALNGGTFDLFSTTASTANIRGTLMVEGNLNIASGATLTSTDEDSRVIFSGTTAQELTVNGSIASRPDFEIQSGAIVKLTKDFALNSATNLFDVFAGGTLDTQSFAISGVSTFKTEAGATIATSNVGGIGAAIKVIPANLAAGTNYIFNGATATPFTIGNTTPAYNTPANITINTNDTKNNVILNRVVNPTGTVTISNGVLDTNGNDFNHASTGTGNIVIEEMGTLRIKGTNTFPTGYAQDVLNTGSTVDYGGANQLVKKLAVDYSNVIISGSGVKTFDNNVVIGNDLDLDWGTSAHLAANQTLTVGNDITNHGETANSLVVEDNASLLQLNETAANYGDITVKKNSNALYRFDYTMWSSPVSGTQTLGAFSPETISNRFYEYKYGNNTGGTAGEYFFTTPSTQTFVPAHAYLIRMPDLIPSVPGFDQTEATAVFAGEFKGAANNGTITRELNTQGNRFTSTGNPYPSPIGVEEFFTTNSSVLHSTTGIYLWRKKNNSSTGSYATVNRISYAFNTSNGAETGGQVNNEYFFDIDNSLWRIAPGQGFIVKTNENATGTPLLTFNNDMRKAAPLAGGQSFFRTAKSDISRYWLNLNNATGNTSQMSVVYMEGGTTGIDFGYDSAKLGEGTALSLYTVAADKKLAIQSRPEFDATDVVNAGYTVPQAGTYTINIDHKDGTFADGQKIYIKDNTEGIIHELNSKAYTFATEAGTFENRFEIIYSNTPLSTDNPVFTAENVVVYKKGTTITADAGTTLINGVTVYDISGRTIYSVSGVNNTTATISNLNIAQQILILEINTVKGKVSKRIIY